MGKQQTRKQASNQQPSGVHIKVLFSVKLHLKKQGVFGGSVVKNPPANGRDVGSIPGQGNKIMLQYCYCLSENKTLVAEVVPVIMLS